MIGLAYLAAVLVAVLVLAVALRRRPAPAAPTPPVVPAPRAPLDPAAAEEVRVILVAAAQLAARLVPAA
ncbi:hypothetical protein [Streptomyces sp. NPDC012825]|uniref:hypothetical protein n=1 Tax=Streptomyces sp. NPDC012825 TaxID=3364851 RepID=UPI0036888300